MANVTITQLPAAGPIVGDELVPIVQNGQTVRTTASAVAGSPVQTQTFLTLNQEPTLNNSRALAGGTGIGLVDGGAQSTLQVTLNGASGSLEAASNGVIVKTGASTVTNRSIAVSGTGLSITNGDGVSGNPTVALDGLISAVAQVGGTGLLAIQCGTTAGGVLIAGTANQINVANGNGQGGNPTISIASNPVLPGTGAVTVPVGTTAQQPLGSDGQIRYNSTTSEFEGYSGGSWGSLGGGGGGCGVSSFSAGTTGLTPSTATTGAVTLGGTLNVDSGGTGATSLTGYLVGNGTSAVTAVSTIPNAGLTNDSVTFNGVAVALGTSGCITAANPNALTIGTGLSGSSYDGSAATTIAIDSTVATLTGTQTLTNKSISGSCNTLSNIPNSSLTNSSVTIGTTGISLGGSSLTLGGLTSVAVTQDPTTALQLTTKQYVDALIASGIHFHQPVRVESPIALTATYNNGTAGVGATLTNAGTQVALVIDGVTVAVNDRVLVYQQVNQTQNGIYVVTDVGSGSTNWVLTRASDADTYIINSANGLSEGSTVFVQEGTTGAGETYTCNTSGVIVFGTTNITFAQISTAQIYSAGTGLTLTGTQFSISNTAVTAGTYGSASDVPVLVVNAQGQVTGVTNTPIAIGAGQITSGALGISNGGTGQTTQQAAINALVGTQTANRVLRSNGTDMVLAQVALATDVSGALAIANGGTGQITQQAALNALSGTQTANRVLRSNGTNVTLSQVALATDVSGTLPVANGGTGQTAYADGQLLIGNSTGNTLTKTTLTAGSGVTITNGPGSITIAASGGSVACATPTVAGIVYGKTTNCAFGGGRTSLGYNANPGYAGIAIGQNANDTSFLGQNILIGNGTSSGMMVCTSIGIGVNTVASGCSQTHIGPIRNAGCTAGYDALFYCSTTREVIRGPAGGGGVCCATSTVAGKVFGITSACFLGGATTALGYQAGGTSFVNGGTAIGTYAGYVSQGNYAVAVGAEAGRCNQGAYAISIGRRAGEIGQDSGAIAIGTCAAWNNQGTAAVAIGRCAATTNQGFGAVAIGKDAGKSYQGNNAIAIGNGAGCCNQGISSIAIGVSSRAKKCNGISIGANASTYVYCAVAIGTNSVVGITSGPPCCTQFGVYGIGIGHAATVYGCNSIAIGFSTSAFCANRTHIGPVRSVGGCTGGLDSLFYNACTRELIRGAGGGGGPSCATPFCAGVVYGRTQCGAGSGIPPTAAVSLGFGAGCGSSGTGAIAIGQYAGNSGQGSQAVAIGPWASGCAQGSNAVSIGSFAGKSNQGTAAVAIGNNAGYCQQCSGAVAVGYQAGKFLQGTAAIAIGYGAGSCCQPSNSIVIAACGLGFNATGVCQFHVKPIRNASGPFTLKYNPCTGEITYN